MGRPNRKRVWVVLALVLGYVAVARLCSEVRVHMLAVPEQGRRGGPTNWKTEAERLDFYRGRATLADLWRARNDRDVSAHVARFLSSSAPGLRVQAVRTLGRLETPAAETALAAFEKRRPASGASAAWSSEIPTRLTVALALARARSRNQRGLARVDAVLGAAGLNRQDLAVLSSRLADKSSHLAGTPARQVMDEVVDVLYAVIRRGDLESADGLGLTLKPSERTMLAGARLFPAAEADLNLDYLSKIRILGDGENLLTEHVARLGAVAHQKALNRIAQVRANPAAYKEGRGYLALYRIASQAGDPRLLPILREIESDAHETLRRHGWKGRYEPRFGRTPDYWLWANTRSVRERAEEGQPTGDLL